MLPGKLLILTFLAILSLQLQGAPMPFRFGNILAAEISRDKITVRNLGELGYDFWFRHYAYAVVAVQLDKGRTLSIYDFNLQFKDKVYKCVALRAGGGSFDSRNWQLAETDPQTIYSLLFILDSETLGNAKKTVSGTLLYALNNTGQTSYKIPFKFINYDKLTQVQNIPKSGVFPEVKIDTRKKKPENPEKPQK